MVGYGGSYAEEREKYNKIISAKMDKYSSAQRELRHAAQSLASIILQETIDKKIIAIRLASKDDEGILDGIQAFVTKTKDRALKESLYVCSKLIDTILIQGDDIEKNKLQVHMFEKTCDDFKKHKVEKNALLEKVEKEEKAKIRGWFIILSLIAIIIISIVWKVGI